MTQLTTPTKNYYDEPFEFTSSIYFYLADSLITDIEKVTRRELGENWGEWFYNTEQTPCDILHKVDELLRQHLEKRFPKKVIREYDDALDEEVGFLFDDY
jgi:hypothetical protein